MDALRFWGDWMTDQNPAKRTSIARYSAASDAVERGQLHGLEEAYAGCLEELEGSDPHRAAAANHNLGVVLQQKGDLDGAVFHCVRSLFLYHRLNDLPGTWAGLRNLAVVFQARGENRRAMDSRRKAAHVRGEMVQSGRYADEDGGRDGHGEPLLLLSLSAGRRLRAVGD